MAGELHTQDDPVQYLDDLREKDHMAAHAVNKSLQFLPPKVLLQNFGAEVGVWSSVNTAIMHDNDGVNAALRDDAGYNLDDLETARIWEWQKVYGSSGKNILAQYALMQGMKGDLLDQVDVPELLTECAGPGVELSQKRIDQYELAPLELDKLNVWDLGGYAKGWDREISDRLAYFLWLDAPIGYALMYKGLPNAMGGIAMRGTSELMIHQLQGVKAKTIDQTKSTWRPKERYPGSVSSRGLMPLDWQKFMVGVNEQIAKHLGLQTTGIQSGENNVWTKRILPRETEPHLTVESAQRSYDVPAQRFGYERNPDDDDRNNWHKPVGGQ